MKRKIAALLMALALAVTLLPTGALASGTLDAMQVTDPIVGQTSAFRVYTVDDAEEQSVSFTYDIPEGGAVVLLFFNGKTGDDACSNSQQTLQRIAESDWITNEKIRVVAVESAGATREETRETVQTCAGDRASYFTVYRDTTGKVLARYLLKVFETESYTYPLSLIITRMNGGNAVRYAGMGQISAVAYQDALAALVDSVEEVPKASLQVPGTRNYDEAAAVFASVNKQRAANGLSALSFNATLTEIAMQRAAEIAVYFSHTRPNGSSCFSAADGVYAGYYTLAENIAAGQSDAAAVMEGWMNSTGHRANILHTALTQIGIGCFESEDGVRYWVQFFGDSTTDTALCETTGTEHVAAPVRVLLENLSLSCTRVSGSATLAPGGSLSYQVYTTNPEFSAYQTRLLPLAEDVTDGDATVASVSVADDGTVTATGVSDGAGVLTIYAYDGQETPFTVELQTVSSCAHTYESSVVAATCTTDGYTLHTCTKCGATYRDSVVPAAHKLGDWITVSEGCTVATVKTRACSVCGYTETTKQSAPGHRTATKSAKAATCTEPGYTGDAVCTVCGQTVTEGTAIAALGHAWNSGAVTTPATESVEGVRTYTCTRTGCGATKTELIPRLSHTHSYTAVVTDPTCTEQGYTTHTCACGDSYADSYTDALGHKTELQNVKAASCTAEGYTGDAVCTVCHAVITKGEAIAKAAHTYKDGKCSVCGAVDPDYKPVDPTPTETPFTDLRDGAFYSDAVTWAVNHQPQITKGTTDTTFSPDEACTRAQVVTFIWRALGEPKATITSTPFTDVNPNAFYYKALLWASENGVVNGTSDTTFSPNDTVTRGQFVTFLWRAAQKPGSSGANPFTDLRDGAFYVNAVLWAAENGITSGTTKTTFSPEEPCTRGQVVTFLYRYANGK